MKKGAITRQRILDKASALFNTRGYAGSSLSDIMQATGLEKGGIYNHFGNKEQLAVESFDYAHSVARQAMLNALQGKTSTIDQLKSMTKHFLNMYENPPVEGGCPLANCALEADDSNPALAKRVAQAFDEWKAFVASLIRQGQQSGEIAAGISAEKFATVLISSLEGALMLSKIHCSAEPLHQVIEALDEQIDELRAGR